MTTETETTENADTENAAEAAESLPQYLLGTKKEMTQVFTENGSVEPVTVVSAGPIVVTQVKTDDADGYSAYQFGYDSKKEKNTPKPQQGHMQEAVESAESIDDYFAVLREYRLADKAEPKAGVGEKITAQTFSSGDVVHVSGISKGKGFTGVVKRHGFAGGPRKHGGQKSKERGPGSIGATGDSTVEKGTKMAGRSGGKRTTVENLEIVHVDTDAGELYIRGGLPGPSGNLLEIQAVDND